MSDSDGSPQRDDRHHRRSRSRSPVSPGCAEETLAEREERRLAEAVVPASRPPSSSKRPLTTPSRQPGSPGWPGRLPPPLRPQPLPPRPRRGPRMRKGLRPRPVKAAPQPPVCRQREGLAPHGPRAPRRGPLQPRRRARRAPSTAPTPSPATPTPAPQSCTRPRPPFPRGGRGPSAPRRPSVCRRASRCRSCSCSETPGAWSRRREAANGWAGVPATGTRGEGLKATEGAPGDGSRGRARAHAAMREGKDTGRAPGPAAAGEDRHTGRARARQLTE